MHDWVVKTFLRYGRFIGLVAVFLFGALAIKIGLLFQQRLSLDETQTAFVTLGCFVLLFAAAYWLFGILWRRQK